MKYYPILLVWCVIQLGSNVMVVADDTRIRQAVTFYASFDEQVAADFGAGSHVAGMRFDHPTEKGQFVFEPGFDAKIFSIARGQGIQGGALQVHDVLPRRGRMYFPAAQNLAFDPQGWGGTVSVWLKTDPNTLLKTPFCDPFQITQKGANDGGLWIDFPDVKPRDMRLGVFPSAAPGELPIQESDPHAPLIWLKGVNFKAQDWHHVAITWSNLDSGKKDAHAVLYVDGTPIGELQGREIGMRWDMSKTGIYVGVNYIGLLDEFLIFGRPLEKAEILRLYQEPGLCAEIQKTK